MYVAYIQCTYKLYTLHTYNVHTYSVYTYINHVSNLDHGHREIRVDSYDVTIFPAESTKNTVSKKAKLKGKHSNSHDDDKYSAWFFDLAG